MDSFLTLEQFTQATDLTQAEKTITISYIVPTILLLNKILTSLMGQTTSFSILIKNVPLGLHDRFCDIFDAVGISRPLQLPKLDVARRLRFDHSFILMAPGLLHAQLAKVYKSNTASATASTSATTSVSSPNDADNQADQPQPNTARGLFSHKTGSAVSSSTQVQINPQQQHA